MLTHINRSNIIILALLAAIIATICDANHVLTQTLSYPNPLFFNQAWWVFPGFFIAFASMSVLYLIICKQFSSAIDVKLSTSAGRYKNMVDDLSAFALTYLMSGFGSQFPTELNWIFYGLFVLRFIFTYEKSWLLILAILLAVGGMFFEGLLAQLGFVSYREPEIFNVPYWLGGVYMHGAFALRSGMRALVYK